MGFLMPPHLLTNFEIQRYYENEPRFYGFYSRSNLPEKIKDGAYVINLDEYVEIGTHWIALFCNKSEIVYFDSFGDEHVPKEIKKFVRNKNIIANIFQVQANDSIMCGYFCIGFIGIKYFLCSIDHFSKCAWVVPLKDKRGISIVNLFEQIVLKGHKPNKIWIDEGGEFYRKFFKGFLKINYNYENFEKQNF